MESLNTNIKMPHRITTSIELVIALITFFSTLTTTDLLLKFLVSIVTYSSARLFYYYFNDRIKKLIEIIKAKIKKCKA